MVPHWFLIALLPPLIWAVDYHIDKIIITKWGKGVPSVQFTLVSGLGGFIAIAFLIMMDPTRLQGGWALDQVWPSFAGGCVGLLALYLYYVAISTEEVTRVASLYSVGPIFGVIFGVGLLGEVITAKHLIGILIVVLGALLVDTHVVKHVFKLNIKVLMLILGSCALYTLGSVGFKQSSVTLEFGDNMMWYFAGSVTMTLMLFLRQKHRQEFVKLFDHKRGWLVPGLIFSNIIGMSGRAVYNYAILLVPIAFVQTAGAFESTFVLLVAYVLWKLFKGIEREDLSKNVLIQKMVSIAIITVGSLLLL